MGLSRRELLATATAGAGALAFGPAFLREALAATATAGTSPYGQLVGPDANGLMLPAGFSSRIVARALQPVEGTGYLWPIFPDGEATYRTGDGGWILVTNSESVALSGAGTSAIRFDPDGNIVGAYRILADTDFNCAGGPTPWGTWLSGEESDQGLVWECDPAGVLEAEARPALGAFKHEAVAVDPVGGRLYLTEDDNPGGFYRFTPDRYPDLTAGALEIAKVRGKGKVSWLTVPDPSTTQTGTPTAQQVPGATVFLNGEGIWYARGTLYFTTKTDKKVWAYDAARRRIEVLFDRTRAEDSSLDAVDNVTVSAAGDVLVCEDGGNMEIGLITGERKISPLLRFTGSDHEGSEVCGVVFNPSGDRLYCTSQRAFGGRGAVYEISGPFRLPKGRVPKDLIFGPPAGEARPSGPLNPGADRDDPDGRLKAKRKIDRRALARKGLEIKLRLDEAASVAAVLDSSALANEPQEDRPVARPKRIVLARARARVERDGSATIRLRPDGRGRRALGRVSDAVRARVLISAVDGAGNEKVLTRQVDIGPAG